MMITITVENEKNDEVESIVFDDHGLEGNDYVTLFAGENSYSVALDDLFPALIAYDAKRSRAKSDMDDIKLGCLCIPPCHCQKEFEEMKKEMTLDNSSGGAVAKEILSRL